MHLRLEAWFDNFLDGLVDGGYAITNLPPSEEASWADQETLDRKFNLGALGAEKQVVSMFSRRVGTSMAEIASMVGIHPTLNPWGTCLHWGLPTENGHAICDGTLRVNVDSSEEWFRSAYKDVDALTAETLQELNRVAANMGCWEMKHLTVAPPEMMFTMLDQDKSREEFRWTFCKGIDKVNCFSHSLNKPHEDMLRKDDLLMTMNIINPSGLDLKDIYPRIPNGWLRIDASLHRGGSCIKYVAGLRERMDKHELPKSKLASLSSSEYASLASTSTVWYLASSSEY